MGWMGIWLAAAVSQTTPEICVAIAPPSGFVAVSTLGVRITADARYHGMDNFTGAPLPGYAAPELWVRSEVGTALQAAAVTLKPQGYALQVLDGYRPVRATQAMVDWARSTDQAHLLTDGYIAVRSGHNHGHTVDLTLVQGADGAPVDMGSAFDHFGVESHHDAAVTPAAQQARKALSDAMKAAGFRSYSKEWWHYRLPLTGTTPLDVPIACEPTTP